MSKKNLCNRLMGIFLTFLLGISSCAQTDGYVIQGELQGVENGTKVYLIPGATHNQENPVAEATVENGKFTFTGQLEEPRFFYLRVGENASTSLMVDNSKMNVSGKIVGTERNGNTYYRLEDVQVKGSKQHDIYEQKIAFRSVLDSIHRANQETYADVSRKYGEARIAGNTVLMDSLNQTEEMKALAEAERQFFKKVEEDINHAIVSNKETFWGPFLMLVNYNYFDENPAHVELFNIFSDEAQESYYGQILKSQLIFESLLDKPLPSFSAADRAGKIHTDTELRQGKKCVMIDFWASWCAPCRKEIPNLKKIYAEYASQGLEIISISIDRKEEDWLKALDEEQLPWANVIDKDNIFGESFNGKTIPAIFLVDENGVVKYDKLRGEELENKVAEMLK